MPLNENRTKNNGISTQHASLASAQKCIQRVIWFKVIIVINATNDYKWNKFGKKLTFCLLFIDLWWVSKWNACSWTKISNFMQMPF